ncbi:DEDDh family exonuclease [Allostreptomyces psammosilenae]|uniref:DNA polymerase-3 subunit epsilon n=1 Tax=Allostreptomyces psammosilenae TaxID=1892865 RepID=A0A852ZLP7_9ACTN|nr:DEDDh family exonuclease [Allostreptomyces psammosilenae]NYI03319.1 DNA polymerase-3 subunit epsilon [Allostreptomyces psammosilenae]
MDEVPEVWPAHYPDGYAVVDVETTGLARTDRIVSVGVYRVDARGRMLDEWYTLVNPERDPGPVWIHGLTSRVLADAPRFPEIADELARRLEGRVLVAHNAQFDWGMISREFARAGSEAPVRRRLCTMALSRALGLPVASSRLDSLAAYWGVEQRQAHNALDDARVLAETFRPSLRLAARRALPLPLLTCLPAPVPSAEEYRASSAAAALGGDRGAARRATGWRRPHRPRPACPWRNPGRLPEGGPLVQGMRVAFTGDTRTDRDALEQRAEAAGLHIATSVSSRTSLLVTNDPGSFTTKARRARELGTPVLDEETFVRLLDSVRPGVPDTSAPRRLPRPAGPPAAETTPAE